MSKPEGFAIARQLIATEAQQQTGFLDLGNLGLTELPEEIHQLTYLRRLNLGRRYHDEAGKYQFSVNRLESNDFSILPLPRLRFRLLVSLSLSDTPVSDLTPLSGLTSLQSLTCSDTSVSDLTPLSGLTSLQSLYCSSTSVSDLAPLSGLTSLQSLDCSHTSVNDLTPLTGLTSLTKLNASRCALDEFPLDLLKKQPPIALTLFETRIPGRSGYPMSKSSSLATDALGRRRFAIGCAAKRMKKMPIRRMALPSLRRNCRCRAIRNRPC